MVGMVIKKDIPRPPKRVGKIGEDNMSWKNESRRHELASRGIGTTSRFSGNPFDNNFNYEMDFDKKEAINFAYRHLNTGTDESTRLTDNVPDTIDGLRKAGIDSETLKEIELLFYKMIASQTQEGQHLNLHILEDKISNILKPHLTAPKLVEIDWNIWEELLWNREYPDDIIDNLYDNDKEYKTRKDAEDYYNEITKNLELGYYN